MLTLVTLYVNIGYIETVTERQRMSQKMSKEARLMSGIILIIVPTIQYGGYFLLNILFGNYGSLQLTQFQKAMFRAGHAHAGVLILLSLICQIIADHAGLSKPWEWGVRVGFPISALLISGGFFFSAMGAQASGPNEFVALIYVGICTLAMSLVTLGWGLIRSYWR